MILLKAVLGLLRAAGMQLPFGFSSEGNAPSLPGVEPGDCQTKAVAPLQRYNYF